MSSKSGLLIIGLLCTVSMGYCLISYISSKESSKERIIGYEVHEMIRASDSSRYMDTVGIIYKKGNTIYAREKPEEYKFIKK